MRRADFFAELARRRRGSWISLARFRERVRTTLELSRKELDGTRPRREGAGVPQLNPRIFGWQPLGRPWPTLRWIGFFLRPPSPAVSPPPLPSSPFSPSLPSAPTCAGLFTVPSRRLCSRIPVLVTSTHFLAFFDLTLAQQAPPSPQRPLQPFLRPPCTLPAPRARPTRLVPTSSRTKKVGSTSRAVPIV